MVEALDGPLALTACSTSGGGCSLEDGCVARDGWGPVSEFIHATLQNLPLSALGQRPVAIGRPVTPADPGRGSKEASS